MQLAKKVESARKIVNNIRKRGKSIGLVPTMGFLHEGHLSLVRMARKKCDFLVVSIFVNPTQFGPKEDLGRYPRNLKRDLRLLRKEGVDVVFYPSVKEMYPEGFRTYVEVTDWSKRLCGSSRPTHFRGVTTVVLKLFNIVEPDVAVFGSKDYQQALIIKKMVKDLDLNIRIVIGKTIREPDGLAMSSRNIFLNERERQNAVILYESLRRARHAYQGGLRDSGIVVSNMRRMIMQKGGKIDYIETVDTNTLEPVKKIKNGTLIALAVFFGRTRLIDNIVL
jgi:pantoate--beta-alanine ligase